MTSTADRIQSIIEAGLFDFNARPAAEKIAAEIDACQAKREEAIRIGLALTIERDAQEIALGEQKRVLDEMREFERTSKLAFEKRVAQVDALKAQLAEARAEVEKLTPIDGIYQAWVALVAGPMTKDDTVTFIEKAHTIAEAAQAAHLAAKGQV